MRKSTRDATMIVSCNKKIKKALMFIVNMGNDNVLAHIKDMGLACDVWKKLKIVYETTWHTKILYFKNQFV